MLDFILQIIIIASAGAIVYLFARVLPRVTDVSVPPSRVWLRVEAAVRRLPLQKLDNFVHMVTEKFLRKVRVVVLKLENIVSSGISKMRSGQSKNGENEKQPNLFEKKD